MDESDRDTTSRNERYRTFLDLSPDGISVVDETGRILTCNDQFARIHGYEHSRELIGRYAAEFASPEQYARLFREVASAFAAGQRVVRDIEVEVFRRDGATVMTEYSVAQASWPDAPAGVAFISNIREITKWKELLAELAQHRAHLEDLVQARTHDLQAEIAERVAVQTALERSETSLLEAERMAHLGSWEIDLAADELRLSDEAGRIYGFDLEACSFTLADVDNAIHPDDRSAVWAMRQRALQSDQGYSVQYRIVLPSGETRVVYVKGEIHRDATGQPTHMQGTVQDITDQERTREALDQRARELASLRALGYEVSLSFARENYIQIVLEKIIAAAGLDMAKLFLLRNGSLHLVGLRVPGAALESSILTCALGECLCGLVARDGQPIVVGDIHNDIRCTRESCKAHGLNSVAVLPLRSRDTVIGVLALGSLARDALAGRLPFLEMAAEQVAIGLQNALLHQEILERAAGLEEAVTERTRELQTERDRTQAILETVSESVVVTDLDGQVLFMNPATAALTGFSKDEVLGQPLWGAWSEQSLAASGPEVQLALRDGNVWHGEIIGRRKDDALYTAELKGTPLHEASAAAVPVGGVWIQRDITSLKEAERFKDQFVSNVSHELRTPLSVISLSCDNLITFYDRLNPTQRGQMLQDIHEQAHLLSSLVEDILQISRINSGRVSERRGRVDLARLVRKEVEKHRIIAERRSQRLTTTTATPVGVLGNEGQLQQVMRNLLDNAIKYTPVGGQIRCVCEIRTGLVAAASDGGSARSGESWAAVEVTDSGIGIAAEDLPFVFERFYRANAETDVTGTGLGLSIAQELVRLHGGWITVASTLGQGSTFTVYLPLVEPGAGDRGRGVGGQ